MLRPLAAVGRSGWALTVLLLAFVEGAVVLGVLTYLAPALQAGGSSAALAGLAAGGPLVALLAIPPIIALHRTILVRQLREKADLDAKTGLLNHAAWHLRGSHALQLAERERRQAALLILDLDRFNRPVVQWMLPFRMPRARR